MHVDDALDDRDPTALRLNLSPPQSVLVRGRYNFSANLGLQSGSEIGRDFDALQQRHNRKDLEVMGVGNQPTQELRHRFNQNRSRNPGGAAEVIAEKLF